MRRLSANKSKEIDVVERDGDNKTPEPQRRAKSKRERTTLYM